MNTHHANHRARGNAHGTCPTPHPKLATCPTNEAFTNNPPTILTCTPALPPSARPSLAVYITIYAGPLFGASIAHGPAIAHAPRAKQNSMLLSLSPSPFSGPPFSGPPSGRQVNPGGGVSVPFFSVGMLRRRRCQLFFFLIDPQSQCCSIFGIFICCLPNYRTRALGRRGDRRGPTHAHRRRRPGWRLFCKPPSGRYRNAASTLSNHHPTPTCPLPRRHLPPPPPAPVVTVAAEVNTATLGA